MSDVRIYKKGVLIDKIRIAKALTKEQAEKITTFIKYEPSDENEEPKEIKYTLEDGYQFHFISENGMAIIVK